MKRARGLIRVAVTVIFSLTLILVALPILGGCAKEKVSPKGTIVTSGKEVTVSRETIKPSGGVIAVDKPGDPLDGFEIEVSAGAYEDTRTFKVSYKVVESHTFGEYFQPISPIITVDNGGGYSEELMTVKIPVEVPDGYFAMAFFYDEKARTLEGMPLIDVKTDSITVATKHFSDFIATRIIGYSLTGEVDSGFRPGVDDWQFPNRGSYIAPDGHCAGQSLTAMWYYYEKTLGGSPHLYNLYDNNGNFKTPELWQDDALGYKFASTIHLDMQWEEEDEKVILQLGKLEDESTWKEFLYAMMLTGAPQLVGIFKKDAGGHVEGHAMLVYKVLVKEFYVKLYVADPNYPGNSDRTIVFFNGKFKPYNSGANVAIAQAGKTEFDKIGYFGKTAIINWDNVTKRWGEFESGTIGEDRFPSYALFVFEDDGDRCPLDGLRTNKKLLPVFLDSELELVLSVYRRDGEKMELQDGKVELEPGDNLLGIYVKGDPSSVEMEWVGFDWVNVYLEEVEEPEKPEAEVIAWAEEDCCWLCPSRYYCEDPRVIYHGGGTWNHIICGCYSPVSPPEGTYMCPDKRYIVLAMYSFSPDAIGQGYLTELWQEKQQASRKNYEGYIRYGEGIFFTETDNRISYLVWDTITEKRCEVAWFQGGIYAKYKGQVIVILGGGLPPEVYESIETEAKKLIDEKLAEMSRK